MKKVFMVSSIVGVGLATYLLINKEMRSKAQKVINTMLDEAEYMMLK